MHPHIPIKNPQTQQRNGALGGFVEFIADTLQTIQRGLVDVIQEHKDSRACLAQILKVLDEVAQTVFLVWHDVDQARLADAPA
jgi:hypothetical protein